MRPIKLTNKEIQKVLQTIRTQLKNTKCTTDSIKYNITLSKLLEADEKAPKEKIELEISETAWNKIKQLVDQCAKEIGWHGTVVRTEKGFLIKDIYLFPQTVTAATVDSDDVEYTTWLMSQPDEVFNELRFHGHSHVNMGVSPSATDIKYQEDILENLKDFYIFAIFNKREDNYCIIYDVENNCIYEDKDIVLVLPYTDAKVWAATQIKQLVTEKYFTAPVKSTTTAKPKATPKTTAAKGTSKTPKKSITDEIMEDVETYKKRRQEELSDSHYGYGYGSYLYGNRDY